MIIQEKKTEVRGVFDKMLDSEIKAAFLNRKEFSYNTSSADFDQIREYIMDSRYEDDVRRLADGDFFFDAPERIRLRKSHSDRRRIVYRFNDDNANLMKMMAFVLHDFDHLYSDSIYSFRIGKHISDLFRNVTDLGCSKTCWVCKADIKSFGDNIVPEVLVDQLKDIFEESDPKLFGFFTSLLLRKEYYEKGVLTSGPTGVLSGCALTNFFENIYLLDIDDYIRANSVYYCRFADDFAIFTNTEEEARTLHTALKDILAERGLSYNTDKTEILPPGAPFDLLGFCVEGGEFTVSEHSIDKIEWKLHHYARKLVIRQQRGQLTKEIAQQRMIDRINGYFFGRRRDPNELNWVDWSFEVLTNDRSLRRLDACAQDCIRIVGSGGKYTKAKYRVRYRDMQKMGYRTLVHAFYHGYEKQ